MTNDKTNTGYRNTGDCNTGYYNTGNYNTGDYNTGNYNTGYCNTITPEDCLIFNKPSTRTAWEVAAKPDWIYCGLTIWVNEAGMTDKEKDAYPSYITTGGYLKAFGSLHEAFRESWDKAGEEDRRKTLALPNFDNEVAKEIFGIDIEAELNIPKTRTIEITEEIYQRIKGEL